MTTTAAHPRIDQMAAAILAAHPHPAINRDTLRAKLPNGAPTTKPDGYQARRRQTGRTGQSAGNTVTKALRAALQNFERAGWISRDGMTNHILNRDALTRHAAGEATT